MSQLSAFSSTGSGCRVLLVKLGNRYCTPSLALLTTLSGSYVLKEWIPKNGQQFSDEELEFFQNEAELLKSHSKDCVYITGKGFAMTLISLIQVTYTIPLPRCGRAYSWNFSP